MKWAVSALKGFFMKLEKRMGKRLVEQMIILPKIPVS
jgi:hypothetical protein